MATYDDYHRVFEVSDTGREVLEDMKKAHHFYDSTFDTDPGKFTLQEGERNVVLRILTMLDI
ncbi:unnamed protein product, partial [marine sediment metagenome]